MSHASSQAIKRTFGLQFNQSDSFTDEELSELKITERDFESGLQISHHGQLLNADQRQLDVSNLKIWPQSTKHELIEHLVQPIITRIYHSWFIILGGILLHGPPGTGNNARKGGCSQGMSNLWRYRGQISCQNGLAKVKERLEIFQEQMAPVVLFLTSLMLTNGLK